MLTWARQWARRGLALLPPRSRRRLLEKTGRYAPWEAGFDHTPPPAPPGTTPAPPDFVGVGTQKSGTSWWMGLIQAHPDVFSLPRAHKELHFFDRMEGRVGTELADQYHGWFPRPDGMLSGEWTPDYMYLPWAPELLAEAAPNARLLILVRDPIERFRSALAHYAARGYEVDTSTHLAAIGRGLYGSQLAEIYRHFDSSQVLVLQFEACLESPRRWLDVTYQHLGLDPTFEPPRMDRVVNKGRAEKQPLGDLDRRILEQIFSTEVALLAEMTPHLDLALWPGFSHLSTPAKGHG